MVFSPATKRGLVQWRDLPEQSLGAPGSAIDQKSGGQDRDTTISQGNTSIPVGEFLADSRSSDGELGLTHGKVGPPYPCELASDCVSRNIGESTYRLLIFDCCVRRARRWTHRQRLERPLPFLSPLSTEGGLVNLTGLLRRQGWKESLAVGGD